MIEEGFAVMRKGLAVAALVVGLPLAAGAQSLNVAVGGAFTSMDPHYHTLTPNNAMNKHVFDRLVSTDENFRLHPGLAESWAPAGDTAWDVRLRRDATFHDGTPFTAEDVVASFARVPTVRNSPGSFIQYTRPVQRVEVVDPHTIRLHNAAPTPLMPNLMSGLAMIRRGDAAAETSDFNAGRAAVGTGPYRLVSYTPGDRVVFARNPAWWGPRQPWERVTYRIMANDSARIAALRAGDVDVIDAVPTRDVETIQADPRLTVSSRPALRNIYLYVDQGRDETPGVTGPNGERLARNPLRDNRVRTALSVAINRDAIVRQVMGGHATPSGQFLAAGAMGHDPETRPDPYDPARATRLLAEAGLPNGFRITLAGPNDRYVNDDRIIQAVAQMWARIGVRTEVQALPSNAYFTRSARGEFSAGLLGWGTGTGEPDSPMVALIGTSDPVRGRGASNRSFYSNPAFDALLDRALVALDPTAREDLYRQATRVAMTDHAIIPLHHQVNIWASNRGIRVVARNDEETMAMSMTPVGN